MRRFSAPSLVVALVLLLSPVRAADRRIVAIADVHGAGTQLLSILQRTGIVDAERHWSGGTAVLVQTGDIMDRGPDVRALLDLFMALEREAAAAGGRVERLLGNHEIMNLVGHTRDATPAIFASWADAQSDARRERAFEDAQKIAGGTLDKPAWMAARPPGFAEYRAAFGPQGAYGKWLRSKPVVVKIDDSIFMHAGIAPGVASSLQAINAQVAAEIRAWDEGMRWLEERRIISPLATFREVIAAAESEFTRIVARQEARQETGDDPRTLLTLQPVITIGQSSLFKADGPMWFRGYSTWTDEEGAPLMAALLKRYRVKRFVTGHTPQANGTIRSRFNGGAYLIDTGMLGPPDYPGGRPSALEIVGSRVTPIDAGGARQ